MAGFADHLLHPGQLRRRLAREEVIQREHGVGLAAAEVRLELNHWVAALPGEPADRPDQQPLEAVGQVGAAEELDRVAVFVAAFAQVNLPQVGSEFGLLIPA
jgi:hypothetical protein